MNKEGGPRASKVLYPKGSGNKKMDKYILYSILFLFTTIFLMYVLVAVGRPLTIAEFFVSFTLSILITSVIVFFDISRISKADHDKETSRLRKLYKRREATLKKSSGEEKDSRTKDTTKRDSKVDDPTSQKQYSRTSVVGIGFFIISIVVIPLMWNIAGFTGFVIFFFMGVSLFCCLGPCTTEVTKDSERQKEYERIRKRGTQRTSAKPFLSERERMEEHYKRARETERKYVIPKKPIPGVFKSIAPVKRDPPMEEDLIKVLRGGEFIGNRMRFKVKVINDSAFIISDVTVYLLSYPSDALRVAEEEHHIFFSKIEPGGFRSPTFDFLPTQDCVRGDIVAGVSYIDERGNPKALTARPFVIRSVCDLLLPEQVTPKDFELRLKDLECGEITVKIEEWTPQEMFDKVLRILDESNFYEVKSDLKTIDGVVFGEISGYAKGKYTGKNIAVEISVTGPERAKGATCKIQVSGEDQAMILPAIDDLRERLNAWLCPQCSSSLTLDNVENLRRGEVVQCPFCGISIGR